MFFGWNFRIPFFRWHSFASYHRNSLILAIILVVGHKTLWHGLQALLALNFKSIKALMLIAEIGAFYLGKYEEAAIILVLYTLAEKLEDIGIAKSQSALGSLIEKMPKTVTLKKWQRTGSN